MKIRRKTTQAKNPHKTSSLQTETNFDQDPSDRIRAPDRKLFPTKNPRSYPLGSQTYAYVTSCNILAINSLERKHTLILTLSHRKLILSSQEHQPKTFIFSQVSYEKHLYLLMIIPNSSSVLHPFKKSSSHFVSYN